MCNIKKEVTSSDKAEPKHQQTAYLMDSPTTTPGSNDETTRVKFLCSFSGSILPRPQDGKLRYVGGETRIVSVPRDITYEELMSKMRELYEGANVLKYQQPDEDLDALVSVVNDDDVTNMMEEYDKLGSSDGFTRLRIFLFAHPDQDGSLHFVDGDERDNERRYVDALNSLNESPDLSKQRSESLVMGSFDDVHGAEHYFSQMSLEGSIHGQRNMELPMAQMNLRQLTIPRLGSGQFQQPVAQRYNDMEAPWSPAYYSPRQPGSVEPRPLPEFPVSPSSCRYRVAYGDFSDRVPEDYNRTPVNNHQIYDQQPLHFQDNVVMVSPSPVVNEKAGFPGNILQGSNFYEGNNSICEYCRMAYHKNQLYPEHPHLDPSNIGSGGYVPASNSCVESPANREMYVVNPDANLHPPYYCRDHYHDTHGHERGWVSPHQSIPWAEELRPPVSATGRLGDGYIMENGVSIPVTHGIVGGDSHHLPPHYVHHEDHYHARPGGQVIQDQAVAGGPQIHLPPMEERVVRYVNPPYMYGNDNVCQVPHGPHIPSHTLWRNVHSPVPVRPSYETSATSQVVNGSSTSRGFIRENSPQLKTGLEYQNPWIEPAQRVACFDGSPAPDYSHSQGVNLVPNTYMMENQQLCALDTPNQLAVVSANLATSNYPCATSEAVPHVGDNLGINAAVTETNLQHDSEVAEPIMIVENNTVLDETKQTDIKEAEKAKILGALDEKFDAINLAVPQPSDADVSPIIVDAPSSCAPKAVPDDQLEFLPELIESVKESALQSLKEVKAKVKVETELKCEIDMIAEEDAQNHKDGMEGNAVVDLEPDSDNSNNSKIELTKAEAEAIDRGLQTIKYEDLEEIRELGSGTYGSVYHGKWKGSDVAIKKIKASCFAARPSERERLIADFWKEALLLSSLHHPNVVSFYGVVRDGPDGSLATVTEYMINGSLKQFLQKKDRTIDRRKRLIIAMDVAFGMEYLHGKKIVHFDLKCENLLVNMRDPHRPVCKIGDMGLSKVRHKTLVSGGVRGTLPWMAPELLNGKCNMVSEKIDVYSFAIVMWELLTGDEPYAGMHGGSIIGGIVNNTLRPQIPTWCDPEWKSLMENCWAADPSQRPSFSEISQKLRNMGAAMNLK